MISLLATILIFTVIPRGVDSVDNLCPSGWSFSTSNSYCYHVSPNYYTMDEAVSYCQSIGGSVVTLKMDLEKTYLSGLTATLIVPPWLGSRRNTTTGKFYNIDGSYIINSYWLAGEPSVNGDCAIFIGSTPSGMRVAPCYNLQPAVCRQQPALCPSNIQYGGSSSRSGTIQSPGYPVQYYNNLRCIYTINSPANTYITIAFNPYAVEDDVDYITVYDGNDTTAKSLGYLDSRWARGTFESSNNSLTFKFYTDPTITDKGWLATWSAKSNTPPIRQSGMNGTMTSPNYPNEYDPYTEQLYYISVATGFQINVTMNDFLTESTFDVLEIYNASYVSSAYLVANLSGSSVLPWSWLSPRNYATFRFRSDYMVQKRGWSLSWMMQ